jgi:hypothetical protein
MRSVTINKMKGSGPSLLELWMNPVYSSEINSNNLYNLEYYRNVLFKSLDLSLSFTAYFSILW